jgi:hypothetical protein
MAKQTYGEWMRSNLSLTKTMSKAQTEISDEDINNAWEMFRIQNPNTIGGFQDQYLSFCFAIKWYREQLKNKIMAKQTYGEWMRSNPPIPQQTAVDWFIEQIKEYDFTPPSNNEEYVIVMPQWIFNAKRDEALEMERLQLIGAQSYAISNADMTNNKGYFDCDKWYDETYGSKGSDETKQQLKN